MCRRCIGRLKTDADWSMPPELTPTRRSERGGAAGKVSLRNSNQERHAGH